MFNLEVRECESTNHSSTHGDARKAHLEEKETAGKCRGAADEGMAGDGAGAASPLRWGCRSPSCPRTSSRVPWRSAGQDRAVRPRLRPLPGPVKAATHLVGPVILSHLLAQQEDALVPLQLLIQRLVQRVPHRHLRDTGTGQGGGTARTRHGRGEFPRRPAPHGPPASPERGQAPLPQPLSPGYPVPAAAALPVRRRVRRGGSPCAAGAAARRRGPAAGGGRAAVPAVPVPAAAVPPPSCPCPLPPAAPPPATGFATPPELSRERARATAEGARRELSTSLPVSLRWRQCRARWGRARSRPAPPGTRMARAAALQPRPRLRLLATGLPGPGPAQPPR